MRRTGDARMFCTTTRTRRQRRPATASGTPEESASSYAGGAAGSRHAGLCETNSHAATRLRLPDANATSWRDTPWSIMSGARLWRWNLR